MPQLAKWAKELYVFQRTPSAVDVRVNKETDPEWWAREVVSRGPGWQRERMENYNAFVWNITPPSKENLVGDGWSECVSYCALNGGPHNSELNFVSNIHELDFPQQNKIRARVDELVTDKATAESLKAWYSSWCKRPCFHDEYLQAFNQPHVKLVGTDGKGVVRLTEKGLVVKDGDEYDLDLIIFGTGFDIAPESSPSGRGGMSIVGRGGLNMQDKWTVKGVGTLHGIISRDFPNLFFPGMHQAATGPKWTFCVEIASIHIAYIITQSLKRTGQMGGSKVTVEPTEEGEQGWTMNVMKRAGALAAAAGCTPGYLNNNEGAVQTTEMTMEKRMLLARTSTWGDGIASYVKTIEDWRAEGRMEGLDVRCSVLAIVKN